ncbi:protein phosphatase [Angomonas deanei]|nr:protein phosphatase [Angomonas deanei]|eukprot:EPY41152.1 protein phosphatase [Angomonas deanei]
MEDAHLVYMQKNWGFFGVFDGHVNDQCSLYLEGAWHAALEKEKDKIPISDSRLKEIALKVDQDWMDTGREGGSTGTFFIALKEGNTVSLQVGNVGDSRVIACINGKCHPMTEDHKPNNEKERIRIEECGGRVEANRVDGSLAVSRAFGDKDYKTNTAGGQLEQKVIALADVTHTEVTFGSDDFAVLCCDGVFESNFENEEVIEFIKNALQTKSDLSEIAGDVCREAIERGSRDNISCVIVQFKPGMDYASLPTPLTVVPGPFAAPKNANFRKVYQLMAERGKRTVGDLLEERYDTLAAMAKRNDEEEEEFKFFSEASAPPAKGTEGRTKWFKDLFEGLSTATTAQNDQMERFEYLQQRMGLPVSLLMSLMNESKTRGTELGGRGKKKND